jgi:hypothetical protein
MQTDENTLTNQKVHQAAPQSTSYITSIEIHQ